MSAFTTLVAVLAAAVPALATIAPSSPISSTTCKGGAACKIAWKEDGTSPSMSSFGQTNVYLAVGNQLQQTILQDLGTVDPSQTSSLSPVIDATCGGPSDKYFIRFQSISATDSSGNPLESFSAMFTLENMSGSFSPAISSQMAGYTSAGEPQAVLTATGGAAATVTNLVTVTQSGNSASATGSHDDSAAAPSARAFGGLLALAGAVLAVTLA